MIDNPGPGTTDPILPGKVLGRDAVKFSFGGKQYFEESELKKLCLKRFYRGRTETERLGSKSQLVYAKTKPRLHW